MTEQHPITPPRELVQQWLEDSPEDDELGIAGYIATQAARWGADQELEACCEWVAQFNYDDYRYQDELRAARRPKPPSWRVLMTEHTTPSCCEAWESWADSANWFVDTEGTYRMPHLKGTRHRFNFCPSCGSERRSAIVVRTELEGIGD